MIPVGFVRRPIAGLPESVEKVTGFLRNDALIGEPPQRFLKAVPFPEIESMMGRNRF